MPRASSVPWRGGWLAMAILVGGCAALAGLGDYGEALTTGAGGAVATGGSGSGGDERGGGGSMPECALDGAGTAWDPALVRTLEATQDARASAVATDGQRRLIAGGWYRGELRGGDEGGAAPVLCPESGATTSGFVARWSEDGSVRDVFCFGDDTADQEVIAIAVAADDTVFAGGRFVGDFAGGLATTEMSGMVLALDPSGLGLAASQQLGVVGEQRVSELLVRGAELFVGGWFQQELDIGGVVTAMGGNVSDAFVVSMPHDLSTADLVVVAGNEDEESGITGLDDDVANGRLVMSGLFGGQIALDEGVVDSLGGRDGFVASVGASEWIAQLGGSMSERVTDVAVGPRGEVFLVGDYETDGAVLADASDSGVVLADAGAVVASGLVAALDDDGSHRWHHWITSTNGPFNFYTVATDGTHVLYGGSYVALTSIEGGTTCGGMACGDLSLPSTTTRSALLAVVDAADGSTSAVRLGQGSQDAYLRDVAFDACGSAIVLLEYSATLSFGQTLPNLTNGIAVARLYRPEP